MERKFAHSWSAENATKAYLKTLKMGVKRAKEPDVSEFISAIAAGNNAQLIVVACGSTAPLSTLLALVAAAHQTGARVICIFPNHKELQSSKQALMNLNMDPIEFVIGDPQSLILEDYKEADFVLIDCKIEPHEAILRAMQSSRVCKRAIVLGFNAFFSSSWQWVGLRTQLLPIGDDGLLVARINGKSFGKKSNWVVRVDQHTGEEHVFRVKSPNGKEMDG